MAMFLSPEGRQAYLLPGVKGKVSKGNASTLLADQDHLIFGEFSKKFLER